MKISKNKLLNLISEAVGEHINQLAYPEKAHDPGDSLPFPSKQKPYERRKEPILQKLRRSIFNAMSNSEGIGREYSIEDISKDISSRYGVPYDEVYDVAVKCLKSRIASGEADYCVSELPPKKKDSQLRVYKKVDESALQKIVAESVKKALKEDSAYQMGRGEASIDAAYQRIDKALDALKHIADTMSDNGYYETEESALRSQINYIEQEINYIRNQ